jgi:alpha-glucosidase (family GH31 glycosyl hydrolase)
MENEDFFQRVRLPGNPHAQPKSMVVRGQARFTVLTTRLLRLEWSPMGEFTDFATFAFPHRYVDEPPAFVVREDGEHLWIDTGFLTLTYRLHSGAFTSENLTITLRVGDETRTWRPGQPDSGNLGGTRRTLDFTGGEVPLEPGLVSRDGWAVFDDSAGVVLQPDDGWVAARPPQSAQDWYFFGYGHSYTDALAEYTRFGGAVPLIPRYVLGVWWSRFWPYSAADLEQLVTDFADHDLPLDVLVVDMDWHLPGHWTGYTWNQELFPDPEAFLAAIHAHGLRVTLNLHPADGVHPHEAAYQELAAALAMDGPDGTPIPFRITDRRFAEYYFTLLHHPLEEQGVDFWWIDWQQGESTDIAGLDPLLWLNHLHFADARRRGQRPLLFSRWGGLGNHRYPIGFSGDTFGGWETLASLPRFTATAANVGFGWWSHDIGGHFGTVDSEIFIRWIQFGALSPCLRLHAVKHLLADRRPWLFPPHALEAIRKAFELRYELVPYLYTMARYTHEHGVALCRPMYYAYPEHESAYHARGQYLLGSDLLAAPITAPADPQTELAAKDVWMPPGAWYRFDTGEAFVGPRWVRITGNLTTIPVFARAGAVVPVARPALHLTDVADDWLNVRVFPGGDGTFRLYEDDGISEAYLRGEYEWTTFTSRSEGATGRVLHIHPVEGNCAALPHARAYRVTFLGVDQPDRVVDETGEPLSWFFDQQTQSVQVSLPMRPKHEAIAVYVRWPAAAGENDQRSDRDVDAPPFMHVIAYTASDEAQRQLARVIVVPPYAAGHQARAWDADILWREVRYAGVTEMHQTVSGLETEAILTAPFVLDATLQPQHWEIEARLVCGDDAVTTTARGPYINPPVQRWSVRYAGQDTWKMFQANAASRPMITEPYELHLDRRAATAAEASAVIELAEAMSISFDTWTNGSLSLGIDGIVLETSESQPTLMGTARPWEIVRYGPVTLAAGKHTVTTRLTAPEESPWLFGVLLVDDTGAPVVRCAHVAADPEQAS